MRISDWSSDVCSSDLQPAQRGRHREKGRAGGHGRQVRVVERAGAPRADQADAGRCRSGRRAARFAAVTGGGADARSAHLPVMYAQVMEGLHRSEEHTSELQSLMRISYAVFCLKKK